MFVSLEKNIKSYPSAYQYCIITIIYIRYSTTTIKWLLIIILMVGSKKSRLMKFCSLFFMRVHHTATRYTSRY